MHSYTISSNPGTSNSNPGSSLSRVTQSRAQGSYFPHHHHWDRGRNQVGWGGNIGGSGRGSASRSRSIEGWKRWLVSLHDSALELA